MGRADERLGKKLTQALVRRLWLNNGAYPGWGEHPDWDKVLEAKQVMADCARYHCLPSQLEGEDYHVIQLHRAIEAAEQRYLDEDRKFKDARPKPKRRR